VREGGTLVNAQGDLSEEGTFGKDSPWCDYSGARDGATEGLAILSSPKNPWHPPKWFTRDYGFFSPTPMYWPENDQHEFAKEETFTLQYRVIVHAGNAKTADIQGMYEKWAAE
ncbi:MAG: PmoA family protein, partial [Candidatus Omnitrophica bacterium]|nr:PmoA family protein [Candidatus Omnitrophota bacterium]